MIFIVKGFSPIVVIFIVISTTFQPIYPPAFFRCLSNARTFTELRTTSFIESTGVACSDFISHNWVQVLSIPILLLASSQDGTCNLQMILSLEALGTNAYNRYAMFPAECISHKHTYTHGYYLWYCNLIFFSFVTYIYILFVVVGNYSE